jgi:NAD(P)H-hydrate epimerase
MATAGSGDVLTGIITGLMAQRYNSFESALLGVYLHGLAGDLAADRLNENSLTASDIIRFLPSAFEALKH